MAITVPVSVARVDRAGDASVGNVDLRCTILVDQLATRFADIVAQTKDEQRPGKSSQLDHVTRTGTRKQERRGHQQQDRSARPNEDLRSLLVGLDVFLSHDLLDAFFLEDMMLPVEPSVAWSEGDESATWR